MAAGKAFPRFVELGNDGDCWVNPAYVVAVEIYDGDVVVHVVGGLRFTFIYDESLEAAKLAACKIVDHLEGVFAAQEAKGNDER